MHVNRVCVESVLKSAAAAIECDVAVLGKSADLALQTAHNRTRTYETTRHRTHVRDVQISQRCHTRLATQRRSRRRRIRRRRCTCDTFKCRRPKMHAALNNFNGHISLAIRGDYAMNPAHYSFYSLAVTNLMTGNARASPRKSYDPFRCDDCVQYSCKQSVGVDANALRHTLIKTIYRRCSRRACVRACERRVYRLVDILMCGRWCLCGCGRRCVAARQITASNV